MTKKTGGEIGTREFVSIILITVAVKVTDMTPILFFKKAGSAGWLIPLVSGLTLLIPAIFLLKLLKKYKDKGLIDIIYILTGKYFGFAIGLSLFVILLGALVLNSRSYVCILKTIYFPRTPKIIIFLFLIGLSYACAKRGLEGIGRTSWFFIPTLKFVLFILILLTWYDLTWTNIYPIAGLGIKNILTAGIKYSSVLMELIALAVIFPFIRNYDSYKTGNLLGFGISILELSLFSFVYLALFDTPAIESVAYPFHAVTRMARLGRFIINLEAFFLLFWGIAAVLNFAIYLYLTTAIFAYTLRIHEFEPLLLPFSILTVLLGMLADNDIVTTLFYRDRFLLNFSYVIILTLPVLLWFVDRVRGTEAR
jgi:spore germination protein KB